MSPQKKEIVWTEVPILIHGITPDKEPGFHTAEYKQLMDGVNRSLVEAGKPVLSTAPICIEWGIPSTQSSENDRYLAEVQRIIASRVKDAMGAAYNGPLNAYGAVRDLIFYGASDLFYYVSSDGETALRNHVFKYIAQQITKLDDGSRYFSLVIFGHSAGSVIAHDLLFHMFGKKDPSATETQEIFQQMDPLRDLVKQGRLRIRKLYTFGSPISPLMLRADSLIKRLRKEDWLDPEKIGLRQKDKLDNPRWVNFWERDDPASYPVIPLYKNNADVIEDYQLQLGAVWKNVHVLYWGSSVMAKEIARTF